MFKLKTFQLGNYATRCYTNLTNTMCSDQTENSGLRERFIQRLILNGKKSVATKIFDESLELLKTRIEESQMKGDAFRMSRASHLDYSQDLNSLSKLTKEEIFIIALRKAQP